MARSADLLQAKDRQAFAAVSCCLPSLRRRMQQDGEAVPRAQACCLPCPVAVCSRMARRCRVHRFVVCHHSADLLQAKDRQAFAAATCCLSSLRRCMQQDGEAVSYAQACCLPSLRRRKHLLYDGPHDEFLVICHRSVAVSRRYPSLLFVICYLLFDC